ncbi:Nucleotidylyl transferase [Suillus hirtellus]|nr:Nucleotidylyl transferase [Suillus hirtellus]
MHTGAFALPINLLLLEKLAHTGSNATYDKSCLHLTEKEVAHRVHAGEKSSIRLNRQDDNLPDRVSPTGIVFGILRDAHASLPTDPVLLKSDLFPMYHLAFVVDDHEMDITHVLRGEEWLPSVPLYLDLYSCLGLKPPSVYTSTHPLEPEWNRKHNPHDAPRTHWPRIFLILQTSPHAELADRTRQGIFSLYKCEVHHACDQRLAELQCLQGRITNLHDVPTLAPFFFVEPDYELPEACSVKRELSADDYGKSRTTMCCDSQWTRVIKLAPLLYN